MARYVVGRKGFMKTTMGFTQAIDTAVDGDIIELEEGFSPFFEQNNTPVTITKSITIEGHLNHDPETGRFTATTIDGVFIKNGASVILRNLEIRKDVDKSNFINIKEGSSLTAENIVLTSNVLQGENYPVIWIEEQSYVSLDNITLSPGNLLDHKYRIYAKDSTLEINNSIINSEIYLTNSRLDCQNSDIKHKDGRTLFADRNSTINAVHTVFDGGAEVGTTVWHCIKLLDSNFIAANITVNQPESSNISVYAENSTLEITDSAINSCISLTNSKLNCQNSIVENYHSNALFAAKNSALIIADSTFAGGMKSEKSSRSCIKLIDSLINASNIVVRQPNYNSALELVNSKATMDTCKYDSLYFKKSEVSMSSVAVMESLAIDDASHVKAEEIDILGKNNGKINLWAGKQSSLEADLIYFGRLSTPNTKAERNTAITAGKTLQLEYDLEAEQFIFDEDGNPRIIGDASEISYFGEKTALQTLYDMTGLQQAKEAVRKFIALADLNKRREAEGSTNPGFSLHCLFLGNPGTGKTTVARLMGKILYEKGVIRSDNFIEVSRFDLVAEYIGQTAVKTREVLNSALGGVLFIDEAYTLYQKGVPQDFGKEAIDEILKFMEDHRTDIVLIFAGYTHNMEEFLESNEGLSSRIPNRIVFEDYSVDELVQIGLESLHNSNFIIDEKAYSDLVHRKYAESFDQSNGRWLRNLNGMLTTKMAVRVSETGSDNINLITQQDMNTI